MRIQKLAKPKKRSDRWRSQAHLNHVRGHACVKCMCAERGQIEVAHVRIGSGAGMGQKPHDYLTVSLCKDCHSSQHRIGERTFWEGFDIIRIIAQFIDTSPRRAEIVAHRKEMER